jgi:hypothetical protein
MNRALAKAAEERGWTYEPQRPELAGRWSGPPFPRQGEDQRIFDVVSGTYEGRSFWAFGLPLEGGRFGASWTVAALHAGRRDPVSLVYVTPRTVVEGITRRIWARGRENEALRLAHDRHVGIELGDDEFDRRFRVRTEDPEAAHKLVTATVRTSLLEAGNLPLAFDGEEIRSWRLARLDLDKLEPLLRLASAAAS